MAIVAYFLGLTIYNIFSLGLKGVDAIPRPSLPSFPSFSLPSFSTLFSRDPRRPAGPSFWRGGRNRGAGGNGYGHIRTYEDEEEDGFAGRFSLDDEDEDEEGGNARALGGDVWRDVPARGVGNQQRPKTNTSTQGGLVNL